MAKEFSIILPSYTGAKTIDKTFASLEHQVESGAKYEVIVIIDGPNKELRRKIDSYKNIFSAKNIDFTIKQFSKNLGRFEARVAGAKLAKTRQLLFLEDRVYLTPNYFNKLAKINRQLLIGNVLEDKTDSNFIADTLTQIRRVVYGKQWGQNFKDHEISQTNFERAPKGMASLWVPKDLFLEVCQEFKKSLVNSKDSSDDTGILRLIVDKGHRILRTSELELYYQPRTGLGESIKHLYQRGPKFVDYYLKPGTRFFWTIVLFYVTLIAAIILTVLWLLTPVVLLGGLIIAGLLLGGNLKAWPKISLGLLTIILVFCSGILVGTFNKIFRRA